MIIIQQGVLACNNGLVWMVLKCVVVVFLVAGARHGHVVSLCIVVLIEVPPLFASLCPS